MKAHYVNISDRPPMLATDQQPPCLIGLAALAKLAFRGADLSPIVLMTPPRSWTSR
jgi:hypothetical protein